MNTKQKIIDALGCNLSDISEDRLVDILLDVFEAKNRQIAISEVAMKIQNARSRIQNEGKLKSDKTITDTDRIDFLADQARKNSTGISINHSTGDRYRISWFRRLGDLHEGVRTAIDVAIAL